MYLVFIFRNILVTLKFKIKLADFGISRTLSTSNSGKDYTRIGTKEYMSPEMDQSKDYDYKTDIWSAGCVIFELFFLIIYAHYILAKEKYPNLKINGKLENLLKKYLLCLLN